MAEILDPNGIPVYLTFWVRALTDWIGTPAIRKAMQKAGYLEQQELTVALIKGVSPRQFDTHEKRQAYVEAVKGCMRQAVEDRNVRRVIANRVGKRPGNTVKGVLGDLYELKVELGDE